MIGSAWLLPWIDKLMGKLLYPKKMSAGQISDILGSKGTLFKSLHKEFKQKSKSRNVNPVNFDKSLNVLPQSFFILLILDSTILLL